MVCKETTKCPEHGYVFPSQVKDGKCTLCGKDIIVGKTEKMSKSLKNVVDPDFLIENYGADTARIFCLFASPPEKDLEWSEQGVDGSFRFLSRLWRIFLEYLEDIADVKPFSGSAAPEGDLKNLRRKTHQTIRKVTIDIEDRFHFNTAISAVMELINAIYQIKHPAREDKVALAVIREALESAIILLSPIVPHITEELWQMLGYKTLVSEVSWPVYDKTIASEEEITIVLQINGKLRSRITVAVDEDEESIKAAALSDEKIAALINGANVRKVIYVPKKLVNIVVA